MSTYPNDGITYQASDIILVGHSDESYLNKYKERSRSRVHIFLYEDKPIPKLNGPILSISQIIKFVMSESAKAELAGLYIPAKEMDPLWHTFVEMGWTQPKTPLQTENTTAIGVTNFTTVAKRIKSMDMLILWLRCRKSQGQF